MIHIIGTCHKTQLWTDLVRKRALGAAPASKVGAFQMYVRDATIKLQAAAIAEELSEEVVLEYGYSAESIAASVARDLNVRHIFCEPSRCDLKSLEELATTATEPVAIGGYPKPLHGRFAIREAWWAMRLAPLNPNTTDILFICGVDHCETFPETLKSGGFQVRIHCPDWTLTAEIPCPCCMGG